MTHPLKIADSTHFRQQYLLRKSHKIAVLEHASRGFSATAEQLVENLATKVTVNVTLFMLYFLFNVTLFPGFPV